MVKKLLKFFVSVVDTQLFKSVEIKNFESSNIQDTNKVVSWKGWGKGSVDADAKPVEKTFENGLTEGRLGVLNLGDGLTFGDEFSSDLNNLKFIVFFETNLKYNKITEWYFIRVRV